MRYYKITSEDEVIAIGTGPCGTEITEAEYTRLIAEIHEKVVHCGRGRNSTARDRRR